MSLRSYLLFLRQRWATVTLFTLLGIAVAMGVILAVPPKYVATSEIFLSTPRFGSVSTPDNSAFVADDFSQQRARSYVQLASRVDLARRVVEKLGIDMKPAALAAATSASIQPDTVLIDVAVKSESADDAKVLADAVTAELSNDIRKLESRSGQLIPVVQPVVTHSAEVPTKPSEPSIPFYLAIGASGGFLIGVTVASRQRRAHIDGDRIEEFTGRPVLGTVESASPNAEGAVADGVSKPDVVTSQWETVLKNIGFEIERDGDRVVAVTTENGSNKSAATTTALARVCASAGSRVILVSLGPNTHHYLSNDDRAAVGVAQVMAGEWELKEAIRSTTTHKLHLLSGPGPENVAPLLRSEKIRTLIDELRESYDLVILDLPDFLELTPSTLLPQLVDSVILVMSEKNVDRRELSAAMRVIRSCQVRLLGSILRSSSSRYVRDAATESSVK